METSSVAEELEKAQREYDAKFETYKSAHAEFQASRENLQKVEDDAKQRAYESVVETYVSVALDRNSKSKTTVPCSEHGGEKRAHDNYCGPCKLTQFIMAALEAKHMGFCGEALVAVVQKVYADPGAQLPMRPQLFAEQASLKRARRVWRGYEEKEENEE